MSLQTIIQSYLYNLIPTKLILNLSSPRNIMIIFHANPGLAEGVIDITYRVKKNTQMRAEGKNHYYPIIPNYITIGVVNINCALSPYLQYAIATDIQHFGLVVRYAGMYLNTKKMAFQKRMLGLWPQNCGVNYPVCRVNPGVIDQHDEDGDGVPDYQDDYPFDSTRYSNWSDPYWSYTTDNRDDPQHKKKNVLPNYWIYIKIHTNHIRNNIILSNKEYYWNTYINTNFSGSNVSFDSSQLIKNIRNIHKDNKYIDNIIGYLWEDVKYMYEFVFDKFKNENWLTIDFGGNTFGKILKDVPKNLVNTIPANLPSNKEFTSNPFILNETNIKQWIEYDTSVFIDTASYKNISASDSAFYNPITFGLNMRGSNKEDKEKAKKAYESITNDSEWPFMGVMSSDSNKVDSSNKTYLVVSQKKDGTRILARLFDIATGPAESSKMNKNLYHDFFYDSNQLTGNNTVTNFITVFEIQKTSKNNNNNIPVKYYTLQISSRTN